MENRHERTEMLIGKEALEKLKRSRVIVFGVGGVGGYTVEALARAGVGHIALVDSDKVAYSNINRQIIATTDTVGQLKTEAAAERIAKINPDASVEKFDFFFENDTKSKIEFTKYDYIVDAIDSVQSKLLLAECARDAGVPIISSMGTGNKLDPCAFKVSDISKTEVCPLARAVRIGLRKRGINHLKVVYSTEKPYRQSPKDTSSERESAGEGRAVPASISFVPSVAGLIIAGEVIKDLTGIGRG